MSLSCFRHRACTVVASVGSLSWSRSTPPHHEAVPADVAGLGAGLESGGLRLRAHRQQGRPAVGVGDHLPAAVAGAELLLRSLRCLVQFRRAEAGAATEGADTMRLCGQLGGAGRLAGLLPGAGARSRHARHRLHHDGRHGRAGRLAAGAAAAAQNRALRVGNDEAGRGGRHRRLPAHRHRRRRLRRHHRQRHGGPAARRAREHGPGQLHQQRHGRPGGLDRLRRPVSGAAAVQQHRHHQRQQ